MSDFNWLPFCDADYAERSRQYIRGGYVCATDGRIAIRLKTDLPDSDWSTYSKRQPPNLDQAFNPVKDVLRTEVPLPVAPATICQECQGKVEIGETEECQDCDGSGEVECRHCGQDMECEECEGTGETGKVTRCAACDAAYTVQLTPTRKLDAKYVLLLLACGVTSVWKSEKDERVSFSIDIDGELGEGLLMAKTCNDPSVVG